MADKDVAPANAITTTTPHEPFAQGVQQGQRTRVKQAGSDIAECTPSAAMVRFWCAR